MIKYNNIPVSSYSLEQVDKICAQEKYSGIVYCYINQINQKRYIGQTISPTKRHVAHIASSKPYSKRRDKNLPFHRAIGKYGIDKFTYTILEIIIGSSKSSLIKEMDDLEKYWIEQFNTTNKQYGYNILNGGVSGERKGTHYLACPVVQYSINGEKISEFDCIREAIQKTGAYALPSAFHRGGKYANGYIWTKLGEPYPQEEFEKFKKRRIHQYTIDGDYVCTHVSVKCAADAVNGDQSRISLCAKPPYINIAYGYRWANIKTNHLSSPPAHLYVEVHQYDSDGNYVASYSNIVEAAKAIGMKCGSHISACLDEHWRRAKQFYFRRFKTEHIDIPKHDRTKTSRTSGN